MTGAHRRARCAFAVLLVCWSLVAPAAATGQADPTARESVPRAADAPETPETADGFLQAFRELEGRPAFQEYSEFEVVRAQAVSAVQVGTFTDDKAQRMALVYEVLVTFEAAYNLSSSGSRVESIERANRTATLLADLRAAGGSQYAALTQIALDRFYVDQGEALHETALATNDTRTKLRLMASAATAYKRGGAVDQYSNLVVQRERLKSTFRADRKTLNESLAAASDFVSQCGEACSSPVSALATHTVGVFDKYAGARATADRLAVAADVTAEHGLSERANTVDSLRERTQSAVFSLAIASAILALTFALVVALVAMAVAHQLSAWSRDVEDSQIGEIVLTEEVVHG